MKDLNERLLAAHAAGDHFRLVDLYAEAAETTCDPAAQGFFLTQSYIFALELDHPNAPALRARLVAMGRE